MTGAFLTSQSQELKHMFLFIPGFTSLMLLLCSGNICGHGDKAVTGQARSSCLCLLRDTPGMAQHTPPQALFVALKQGKVAHKVMFGMALRSMQRVPRTLPSVPEESQEILTHTSESFQCHRVSRYGKLNP